MPPVGETEPAEDGVTIVGMRLGALVGAVPTAAEPVGKMPDGSSELGN